MGGADLAADPVRALEEVADGRRGLVGRGAHLQAHDPVVHPQPWLRVRVGLADVDERHRLSVGRPLDGGLTGEVEPGDPHEGIDAGQSAYVRLVDLGGWLGHAKTLPVTLAAGFPVSD